MYYKYVRVSGVNSLQVNCNVWQAHFGHKTMERSAETPEQIPPDAKFYSVTEFSPIVRNDLYYLKTRFNAITIACYDSTTNNDSNGCTFEENIDKCLKPPTYIRFVDPKNRVGNILPENLTNFYFIEAIDLSDCGLTEFYCT